MNVYLHTIGCRLNEAERETWARAFRDKGHGVVRSMAEADVGVFNSCAVTAEAARSSRKTTRRLHRMNPKAKLVLTGCYAALDPEQAAALQGVDLVVPNEHKDALPERVMQAFDMPVMPAMAQDEGGVFPGSRARAFIKVQDGCRNRCTFCIVTVARGEERSRTLEEVAAEVRQRHAEGYQEAVVTGVHLGGYGSDVGTTLRELVQYLLDHTEIPRIRLGSLEPWELPEGFFEVFRDPRMCRHLHLPMQSGANWILKRMARRCTVASFDALVADARAVMPDVCITTDLIVGFPGETEAHAAETLAWVRHVGIADAHIFAWSPREGTAATRFPGRVPREVQRVRSRALHEAVAAERTKRLQAAVGQVRQVLWESEREPVDGGFRVVGYTDTFLRTEAIVPDGRSLRRTVSTVRLTGVRDDRLVGQVV